MANYNRSGWLDTAMGQVRSKPEHKAIRAELLGHMEDKEQYFLDAGMELRDAAKAAVDAMGDPIEVGKELDRAHPVWWGKLYTGCKAVIVLLCFVMLFCIVDYAAQYDLDGLVQNYPLGIKQTDPHARGGEGVLILDVEQEPVTLSGYTVKVTQAYWSPKVYSGEENILEVDVKVSNLRPWASSPLFMGRMEMIGDENVTGKLCVALSSGSRISGGVDSTYDGSGEVRIGYLLDQRHNDLKDYRYWGSWYFTYVFYGVEPGDTVTLHHPDHEELAMTFEVGVTE